jgi:hypothetical protein
MRRIEDASCILGKLTPVPLFVVSGVMKRIPKQRKRRSNSQPIRMFPTWMPQSGSHTTTSTDRFQLVMALTPWLTSWTGILILIISSPMLS